MSGSRFPRQPWIFPPQYLPPLSACADSEAAAGTRYKKAGGAERPERGPVSRGFPWRESYCRSPRRLPCRWGGTRVSQSRRLKYFLAPSIQSVVFELRSTPENSRLGAGPGPAGRGLRFHLSMTGQSKRLPSPSRVLPDKHKKTTKVSRGASDEASDGMRVISELPLLFRTSFQKGARIVNPLRAIGPLECDKAK